MSHQGEKNLRRGISSANQYKKHSVEYFPSRILLSVHVCIISKNQKQFIIRLKLIKLPPLQARPLTVTSFMIPTLYVLTYNIILKLKCHCKPYPVLFPTSIAKLICQYIIFQSSVVRFQCSHYFNQCLVNVFVKSCL